MEDVKRSGSNLSDTINKSASKPSKSFRESHIKEVDLPNKTNTVETKLNLECIECIASDFSPAWMEVVDYAYYYRPGTFSRKNYIYDSADSTTNIIDTLNLGEPLNILKEYKDFYLVCTPKSRAGFIKKTDVFLYYFYKNTPSLKYYCGIINHKPFERLRDVSYCQSTFQIIKTNPKGEIMEVFIDTNIHRKYRMTEIYYSSLKNVDILFHLSYYYLYAEEDKFIIDNGKIMNLISGGGFGDGGYYDEQKVYLPIKLESGKVVLVHNGKLKIDTYTLKANTFPYSKEIGIPIEDLIVVEYTDAHLTEGFNEDGSYAIEIHFQETIHYQWDGKELHKRNTIIQKQYEE